jgi:hypothetical protein
MLAMCNFSSVDDAKRQRTSRREARPSLKVKGNYPYKLLHSMFKLDLFIYAVSISVDASSLLFFECLTSILCRE